MLNTTTKETIQEIKERVENLNRKGSNIEVIWDLEHEIKLIQIAINTIRESIELNGF